MPTTSHVAISLKCRHFMTLSSSSLSPREQITGQSPGCFRSSCNQISNSTQSSSRRWLAPLLHVASDPHHPWWHLLWLQHLQELVSFCPHSSLSLCCSREKPHDAMTFCVFRLFGFCNCLLFSSLCILSMPSLSSPHSLKQSALSPLAAWPSFHSTHKHYRTFFPLTFHQSSHLES